MSELKFFPTHRMLLAANATDYTYNMVSFDVNNGTFRKETDIKSDDTKIRAKKGINAEILCYNGNGDRNQPMTDKSAIKVVDQLNIKRAELGFEPLSFLRIEEKYKGD